MDLFYLMCFAACYVTRSTQYAALCKQCAAHRLFKKCFVNYSIIIQPQIPLTQGTHLFFYWIPYAFLNYQKSLRGIDPDITLNRPWPFRQLTCSCQSQSNSSQQLLQSSLQCEPRYVERFPTCRGRGFLLRCVAHCFAGRFCEILWGFVRFYLSGSIAKARRCNFDVKTSEFSTHCHYRSFRSSAHLPS